MKRNDSLSKLKQAMQEYDEGKKRLAQAQKIFEGQSSSPNTHNDDNALLKLGLSLIVVVLFIVTIIGIIAITSIINGTPFYLYKNDAQHVTVQPTETVTNNYTNEIIKEERVVVETPDGTEWICIDNGEIYENCYNSRGEQRRFYK